MPEPTLDDSSGRHALLMLRLALFGVSGVERGVGNTTPQDIREAKAICASVILDSIKLLDFYLTGDLLRRETDAPFVTDLVHQGMPWDARLSNEAGSVLKLRKLSSEEVSRNLQPVLLDLNGPLDETVKSRWLRIDASARPKADFKPLAEQFYLLMQGKGYGDKTELAKLTEEEP